MKSIKILIKVFLDWGPDAKFELESLGLGHSASYLQKVGMDWTRYVLTKRFDSAVSYDGKVFIYRKKNFLLKGFGLRRMTFVSGKKKKNEKKHTN